MTNTLRTRTDLKSRFETGDIPVGSDYNDWITTMATQSGSNTFSSDTQTFLGNVTVNGEISANSVSAPTISADSVFVSNNSIHFYNGATISSTAEGDVQITNLKVNDRFTATAAAASSIKQNLSINSARIFNPDVSTLKATVFAGKNEQGWYRILEHDSFIHGQLKITLKGANRTTAIEYFVSVEDWTNVRSIITQENCLVRGNDGAHIKYIRTAKNQNGKVIVDLFFHAGAIDDLDNAPNGVFKFEFIGEFARPFKPVFEQISIVSNSLNQINTFNSGFYAAGLTETIDVNKVERLAVANNTGFLSNGVIRFQVGSLRDAGLALAADARGAYAHGLALTAGTQFFTPASDHFHLGWSPAPYAYPNQHAWWGNKVQHNIYAPGSSRQRNWQQSNSISPTTQENFLGGQSDFLFRSIEINSNSKYAIDTERILEFLSPLERPPGPLYEAEVDFYYNDPVTLPDGELVTVHFIRGIAGISAAILPGKIVLTESVSFTVGAEITTKYRVRILLTGLNDIEWNPQGAAFETLDTGSWSIFTTTTQLVGTSTISFDPENRHILTVVFNTDHHLSIGQVTVLQFGNSFKWSRSFGWGPRLFNCCVSKIISATEVEITLGIKRNTFDHNVLMWERQALRGSETAQHFINIGGFNGHVTGDKVRFRSTGQLPEVLDSGTLNGVTHFTDLTSLNAKTTPFQYGATGNVTNSYQLRDDVDYYIRMGTDQYWMGIYYTEDGARNADPTQRVFFAGDFFGDGIVFMRLIDRPEGITRLPSASLFGDAEEYFVDPLNPSNSYNKDQVFGTLGVREPLQTTITNVDGDWALFIGNTDPAHQQTIADVGWSMSRNIYENKNNIARGVIHRVTLGGLCDVPYAYQGSSAVGFNTRTHADMAHSIGYNITNKTTHSFEAGVDNDFKLRIIENEASFVDSNDNKSTTIQASGINTNNMTLSHADSALTFTNTVTSGLTVSNAEYILVTLNGQQRAIQLYTY